MVAGRPRTLAPEGRAAYARQAAGQREMATMLFDVAECDAPTTYDPNAHYDLYASLHAPETADTLDFSEFTAPLPALDVYPTRAPRRRARTLADVERVDSTSASVAMRAAQPAPAFARRVANVSRRLSEVAVLRPEVRIPGRVARPARGATAVAATPRRTKLPPVWLLANVAILIVTAVAILPRVVSADAAAGCKWHIVMPGDTLGQIGWLNHTDALALAKANNIQNPDLIYVGQSICIPLTEQAHANSAPKVPAAPQPPQYGSATGVSSFLKFALPYARRAHEQTGWPMSLILAQWGLEQGWKAPGYTGFNFGNVAALPGEPTVNGIAVPGSPAAFAFAHTPEDGLRYYVRVAQLSFYDAVGPTAAQYGADAAARALGRSPWDAGHYTDSNDPGSSLLSIMRVYNLYWYDHN